MVPQPMMPTFFAVMRKKIKAGRDFYLLPPRRSGFFWPGSLFFSKRFTKLFLFLSLAIGLERGLAVTLGV
jgi:hypothetical protein